MIFHIFTSILYEIPMIFQVFAPILYEIPMIFQILAPILYEIPMIFQIFAPILYEIPMIFQIFAPFGQNLKAFTKTMEIVNKSMTNHTFSPSFVNDFQYICKCLEILSLKSLWIYKFIGNPEQIASKSLHFHVVCSGFPIKL